MYWETRFLPMNKIYEQNFNRDTKHVSVTKLCQNLDFSDWAEVRLLCPSNQQEIDHSMNFETNF